jgi:hypothetical protein
MDAACSICHCLLMFKIVEFNVPQKILPTPLSEKVKIIKITA